MKDLKWYVYYHDFNGQKIKTFNIFKHGRFREDVEKYFKKYKDKEEFTEHLRSSLFYYYCSKAEWEVVVTSWVPHITMSELDRLNAEREDTREKYNREPYSLYVNPNVAEKIDIYDQVMNNFDIFVDYVWSHKPTKRRYKNKSVGKCYIGKDYCRYLSNGYCVADDKTVNDCPYLSAIGEIARLTAVEVVGYADQSGLASAT